MAANTKIEWADHTFNPWTGCSNVSPACDHCYAERWAQRSGIVEWGGDRRRTSAANWKEPAKLNRLAEAAGKRASVFCLSLGDIWDNEVEPQWRRDLFMVMEDTPWLTWLLLSKRIGNAIRMCSPMAGNPMLPRNAALGATMVNQEEWDRDEPKLRRAKEALEPMFTFASVEPMLGPINMHGLLPDWIICGGESGPGFREINVEWPRSLLAQSRRAGVPFFMKQMSGGVKAKMPAIPDDLMVREFPA